MKNKYTLVGDGRLATHLSFYFSSLNLAHSTWSRRQNTGEELHALLEKSTHVLLAISDKALTPFLQEGLIGFQGNVIHFSGALEIQGARSAHPLASFGPDLFQPQFYKQIPFILTEGKLSDLIPELPNPSYIIPAQQKALYHALCVMSGNFTTLLWQQLREALKSWDVPTTAMLPYLETIAYGLKSRPEQALTGPLARNDYETIEKNLKALLGHPYEEVYRSFIFAYTQSQQRADQKVESHVKYP